MKKELETYLQVLLCQPEYERKQIALILICSTLNNVSDNEARDTYDKIKDILL